MWGPTLRQKSTILGHILRTPILLSWPKVASWGLSSSCVIKGIRQGHEGRILSIIFRNCLSVIFEGNNHLDLWGPILRQNSNILGTCKASNALYLGSPNLQAWAWAQIVLRNIPRILVFQSIIILSILVLQRPPVLTSMQCGCCWRDTTSKPGIACSIWWLRVTSLCPRELVTRFWFLPTSTNLGITPESKL